MAEVIKFSQNLCGAKIDDNSALFVRVEGVVHKKDAIIEVPITHNAIVIKGGGDMRYYKSGNYPVFDDKKEVRAWKTGLSVEVIYIPKDTEVQIKWGTPNRIKYRDRASNKVISVGARGEFAVSVSNPEQFFRKVVGVKKVFDLDEFSKRFSETVAMEFADVFLKVVDEQNLTYDLFHAKKKELSGAVGDILSAEFDEKWGLNVKDFIISDFSLLDEETDEIEKDAAAKKIQEGNDEIKDKNHEKLLKYLKEFDKIKKDAGKKAEYLRLIKTEDPEIYSSVMSVLGLDAENAVCPSCGAVISEDDLFCPKCGKQIKGIKICPDCGRENEAGALYCSGCGKKL